MRLIERSALLVVGLLAITLITVVLVAPEVVNDFFITLAQVNFIVRLVVVLVIDVAILAFLYSRLRPARTVGDALIVKASGAIADVSIDSAQTLILNAVKSVSDVVSASAVVQAVGGKADIELHVQVTGQHINVPQKQQEINRALKQVVNKQLGLQIANQPRVHIRFADEQTPVTKKEAIIPETPRRDAPAVPESSLADSPVPAKDDENPSVDQPS